MTKEQKQTMKTAGAQLGTVRNRFGITQHELMCTGHVNMGYTMLSRTERGERTPTPMDIISLIISYMSIDENKLRTLVAHEDFRTLRDAIALSCDDRITFYIDLDKQYGTSHEEKIQEYKDMKTIFGL